MKRGIRSLAGGTTVLALAATLTVGALGGGSPALAEQNREYLVFYADGARDRALAAIGESGGTALSTEPRLGYVVARGPGSRFVESLAGSDAVEGVSSDRRIGQATSVRVAPAPAKAGPASPRASDIRSVTVVADEPLAGRQWDMKMIGATADGSYATAPGDKKVLVGVIDTGIDGKHPDIAPNFNRELSRNFVVDRPKDPNGKLLDGPCEFKDCKDPADWDDDGHGTHVASTIASPINGLGMAGVAPQVSLVNLRAGLDSGLFFLKPSMEALTYAADAGIDVVNMSFYVDPWLFNCKANPADSKAEQLEQRGVITGMQRALDYARKRGVTLIGAIGNNSTDLGKPKKDTQSPNYPKKTEHDRKINNSCLNVPAESEGVISVSAVGPTKRKAYYSDYGIEQTDLAAPGGDEFDGGKEYDPAKGILAAAPENMLRAQGLITLSGVPKSESVVQDCRNGTCAYYQYLVGTSMAAPHATGVAAILISRFGKPGKGGLTMKPAEVQRLLYSTAERRSCPSPRKYTYDIELLTKETHKCEGSKSRNGFYGHGIVDAAKAAAVTR
ncbi:subtilisin family serine protease [Streptosporangium becharense]|uniref:Subtilisin family serine protease n=1 Tax=Streptosporangium becharense TaxID=1816182 RepID=A0A7W9ICK8_9ACTN|nr:S8 family serine peptidase [Streptosporangium becharense]MBB2912925.1 subtilisin family serine protease [Streptosporangium becharense]MBB5818250.1 subtilisin family serine protease [Streptosporangium becharense]